MKNIPDSGKLINVILSKTQRKTPTEIHRQFSIVKIRQFYIRKVKFVQEKIEDYLSKILGNFPSLSQLHPFFSDFFNILFSKNCYKIALNRLYKSKLIIINITNDYIKLIKYGKTLYACKQLKKIAIGKIVKILKKLNLCFIFLEKIRLYLMKIPSIDPHRKTLLIGGCSGVGKSSFMNKITKAGVEVSFGSLTTKSLSIGHFYRKFFRWQVIDSPGIDNENFENFSSSEIQTVNVVAHLDCTILYIFDPSEILGLDLFKQISVFLNFRKCFRKSKQIFILTKTDLGWEKKITKPVKGAINRFSKNITGSFEILKSSFHDELGIVGFQEKIGKKEIENTKILNRKFKQKTVKTDTLLFKTNIKDRRNSLSHRRWVSFYSNLKIKGDLDSSKNNSTFSSTSSVVPLELKEKLLDFHPLSGKQKRINHNSQLEKEIKLRELRYERNYVKINLKKLSIRKSKRGHFKVESGNRLWLEKAFLRKSFV